MSNAFLARRTPGSFTVPYISLAGRLGIAFGILMPVVAALLFPTYVHKMPLIWQERARLLELPFVLSELALIVIAVSRGLTLQAMWRQVSRDVRVAVVVLLATMAVSSVLMASQTADAVLQSLIQLVHLYFALAVFYLARMEPVRDWSQLLVALVAGVFVIALYSAFRLGFPPPLSRVPGGAIEWDFALPGFISVRYLGTWLGAIGAALAIKLLYLERHVRPTVSHGVFVFVLGFMFWTGTRAAVLGVLAAIVFSAITLRRLPSFRSLLTGGGLALLALALAIVFEFGHPVFRLYNLGEGSSLDAATSGRTVLWHATLARWWESPLTGWGTGGIFFDVKTGWTHTQPHNSVIQFLVDWGIFGALAAVWLIARAVVGAARVAIPDRQSWPILAMVYSLLAMSMVDGALYYPRFIIMIVIGLALLIGARSKLEISHLPTA